MASINLINLNKFTVYESVDPISGFDNINVMVIVFEMKLLFVFLIDFFITNYAVIT